MAPASLLANWAAEVERFAPTLTVDRGPFEIPKAGVPYLSHEGYRYRLLHDAHADLVRNVWHHRGCRRL